MMIQHCCRRGKKVVEELEERSECRKRECVHRKKLEALLVLEDWKEKNRM